MRVLALLLALLAFAPPAFAASAGLALPVVTVEQPAFAVEATAPEPTAPEPAAHTAPLGQRVKNTRAPPAPEPPRMEHAEPVAAAVAERAADVIVAWTQPPERVSERYHPKLDRLEHDAAGGALGARTSPAAPVPAPPALPAPAPPPPAAPAAADAAPAGAARSAREEPPAPPAAERPATAPDDVREPWTRAAATAGLAFAIAGPLLLYHRLRESQLLRHDNRARLLELLRERPGLSRVDASRALGVDPTTALYHLRRLEKDGLATIDGVGRHARYFAAGSVPSSERVRVVAEREAAPVLAAVRDAPGTSKSGLARRLDIARATLAWHLARLHRAGLVRFEKEGRAVRVFPAGSRQETFS